MTVSNSQEKRNRTLKLVALAVFIPLVVFIVVALTNSNYNKSDNNAEVERIEKEQKAQQVVDSKREMLDGCIADAYTAYKKDWDSSAQHAGSTDGRLPQDQAEFLDKRHKEAKDECYKRYELN